MITAAHIPLAWLSIVIFTNVLAVIQLYGLYWFYSLKSLAIIKKRYPKFVMIEAALVIVMLSVIFPFWSRAGLNKTEFNVSTSANTKTTIIDTIGEILFPVINHLVGTIEATRLYLMYFDLRYLASSKEQQWKSQIDSAFSETNCYLKNKHKYGNTYWILKRVLIYYLFVIISTRLAWTFYEAFAFYVEGFFYVILISFVLYLWINVRQHQSNYDNFLFYYEFRSTMLLWSFCFTVFCVWIVLVNLDYVIVAAFAALIYTIFAFSTPSLLSTLWITRKISKSADWRMQNHTNQTLGDIPSESTGSEIGTCTFLELLKDECKFELFMDWMHREFSSESALCFIELSQFKACMVKVVDPNDDEDHEFIDLLHESIPKSSIVHGYVTHHGHIKNRFKKIAHSLYQKYIAYNSPLEINISAVLRNEYVAYDDMNYDFDDEMDEFVNAFDNILHESFSWMKQSFGRMQNYELTQIEMMNGNRSSPISPQSPQPTLEMVNV